MVASTPGGPESWKVRGLWSGSCLTFCHGAAGAKNREVV